MRKRNKKRSLISSKTVILISILLGMTAWLSDALLDYMLFYEGSFLELLILDVPNHELYIRTVWMFMLLIFGVIISREIKNREEKRKKIIRLNSLLKSLGDVNQMLLKADDPDEMIKRASEILYTERGYYNVWIALFDEKKDIKNFAQTGLEENKEKLQKMIMSKDFPSCVKKVKEKKGLITVDEPSEECRDCPLSEMYGGRGSFVMALRHRGSTYGLISASIPKKYLDDEQERAIFVELVGDLSYGVYNLKMQKVKEKVTKREEFLHSLLRHDVENKNQIVKGYLELMKEYDLPDEVKDFLEKSEHTVKESSNIIEKVRKLREIEEKEEIGDVNLNLVLDKVLSEHQDQLEEKGIKLNIEYYDHMVKGGPLLKTLFSNLVINAVQHSNCEKIKITSQIEEDECVVTLEDDGAGISDEAKDKIFEKGFKAGESFGTGLGLYMVKEIANSYGGDVEVKDSDMGGARFEVRLKKAEN